MAVAKEIESLQDINSKALVYKHDSSASFDSSNSNSEQSSIQHVACSSYLLSELGMTTPDSSCRTVEALGDEPCNVDASFGDDNVGDDSSGSLLPEKRSNSKRELEQRSLASVDATNGEIYGKRRRVQHNYRRLSSSGYVDDYDGRERFSGELATPSSGGNSSTSPKAKNVGAASPRGASSVRPVGGTRAHKLRCETDVCNRGWC
jgi:hypothetical protein